MKVYYNSRYDFDNYDVDEEKYNYDDFGCDYDYADSIDFDISAEEIKAMNQFLGKTKQCV